MSPATYRRRARRIIEEYIRRCGLSGFRCTRLRIQDNLKLDGRPVWAYCHVTGPATFVIALTAGMPEDQLRQVLGHELCHVYTSHIIDATNDTQRMMWEELLCDVMGDLLANAVQDM